MLDGPVGRQGAFDAMRDASIQNDNRQAGERRPLPLPWMLVCAALFVGCAPTLPPRLEPRADLEPPQIVPTEPVEITYDRSLCGAIGRRWLGLLEQTKTVRTHETIMVAFVLHADGSISDLRVAEPPTSEVAPLLCLRAVEDTVPYPPWPAEMRKHYGAQRALLFSFQFDAQERGYLAYWDQGDLVGAKGESSVFIPGENALMSSTNRPWRLTTLPVSIPKSQPRQVWTPNYSNFNYDLFVRPEPLMPPVWSAPVVIPPANNGPGPNGR